MTTRSMSPRRRHILSSINPDFAPLQSPPSRSRVHTPPAQHPTTTTTTTTITTEPEARASLDDAHAEAPYERRRRRSDDETDDHEGEKKREDRKRTSKFRFKSKSRSSRHADSSSQHTSSRHHRDRDRERQDRYAAEEGLEINLGRPGERDDAEDDCGARSATAHGAGGVTEKNGDYDDKESVSSRRRHRSHHHRRHHSRRHDKDRDKDDREREPDQNEEDNKDSDSRHRHKRRRHHRHRRKRDDQTPRSPTPPNPYDPPPLDPDAAFRESLFDAMADDEGAAYWEAVYGQPIHIYNNHSASAADRDGLGEMDDEEYAAHVRQKMWEKTHEGLLEERRRRDEARKRKEEQADEAARLTREMERSLRRGEDRRRRKAWLDKWTTYLDNWEAWDGTSSGIAWPVAAAASPTTDIDPTAVREFLVTSIDPKEVGETEYLARLKNERVRWHPDKIQQRLGGKVDDAVMRNVTAVFQVVDKLWSDARASRVT